MTQRLATKSGQEEVKSWTDLHEFLTSGLLSIASILLATFLSFYVSKSKSPGPDILTPKTLYFVGGVGLLAFLIVGIASFMRRKNRDVILLKQRLATIYLSALKKSALNPQLESPMSND